MFNFRDIFMVSVLITGILLIIPTALNGFTVDNHLVSARNDCFERIALEAMLPIEKTFRTEDTNSLKMCKDKCTQAGEKCQSISFGVHRRGNGTCQLSTEKFDASSGRPRGVIFDPDFDLYARKTNCFDLNDNTISQQEAGGAGAAAGDDAVAGEGYGGVVATTQPLQVLSNLPSADPSLLVANPSVPSSTSLNVDQSPPPTLVYGSTQFYSDSPIATQASKATEGDRLLFSHDIYPLYRYPMLYEQNYPAPNEEVYIPGGYASNVPEVEGHYRPGHPLDDNARPSGPPRPIFGMGYGNGYSYGKPERYRPSEPRPHEYEPGSMVFGSLPDQRPTADRDYASLPGYYTSDRTERPERPDRFDRPGYPDRPDQSGRPGYHDQPDQSDRPGYHDRPDQSDRPVRPEQLDRPTGSNNMRPSRPGYGQISPTYYPRPEYVPSTPTRAPSDARPTDVSPTNGNRQPIDYTNRPDPPQQNHGPESSSSHPPGTRPGYPVPTMTNVNESNRYDYVRRNGTGLRPMPTTYNDDKTIAIFFNPDDYQHNKKRPGGHGDRHRLGYPMDAMKGIVFCKSYFKGRSRRLDTLNRR